MTSAGLRIGVFCGGICFLVFGLKPAVHAGGFSILLLMSKWRRRPVEQSFWVRILVAAGIVVSVLSGIVLAMVLGGVVGATLEYALVKIIGH